MNGRVTAGQIGRERLPRMLALIEEGRERGQHIGVQLYVSLRGEVIADLAIGESRPGVPMQPGTLMLWLSSSKPVAAVAVAQLVERGALDYDAPVASYVPEFAEGGKEAVTLRHLLTHTGGFRTLPTGWPQVPWEKTIARICAMPLEPGWVPGEKAGYHPATSWFMLGEIIRRVDGRVYSQYVREEIFEPLGMRDSWIGMPIERYREYGERIGILQNTERGGLEPHAYTTEAHVISCAPGANGHGPLRELGWFYEMLLGGGERNGVRILSPESVSLLTTRQRERMYDLTFMHTVDWGLGFIINSNRYGWQTVPYGFGRHASEGTFGHGGMQSSAGFADPERQLAVAIICNGTPGEARHTKRIRQLATALYEDLFEIEPA